MHRIKMPPLSPQIRPWRSNASIPEGKQRRQMMRIQRSILFPGVITVAFALSALAAEVTGKWNAVFDDQIGRHKYTFEFKVEGEKLTGKAYEEWLDQKGEVDLLEGKMNGTEISFVEKRSYDQPNVNRIEYTGKINGNEIRFTRKFFGAGRENRLWSRQHISWPSG